MKPKSLNQLWQILQKGRERRIEEYLHFVFVYYFIIITYTY